MSDQELMAVSTREPMPVNETSQIMTVIEKMALMPNINMDNIERMVALYEKNLNRQAKMEFNASMSLLQADLPMIDRKGEIKDKYGKTVSKYAKFEDINEAVKPHMAKHGFSVSFKSNFADDFLLVTGILSHKGGHSEETTMKLPFDTSGFKNNVQAVGSSSKYGMRYAICMLLNISTGGDDDDGNSAAPKQGSLEVGKVKRLRDAVKLTNHSEEDFCKGYGVTRFEDLPDANFNPLLNRIRKAANA